MLIPHHTILFAALILLISCGSGKTSTTAPIDTDSCLGQSCSGHGACEKDSISGGAMCVCDSNYHADGLSCVSDDGDGQLQPGHYHEAIPWASISYANQNEANTEAFVIFPRPNSETSIYARQRWAHPAFDYQIPIAIRGGAFPYHMVVDTDKTHMALAASISIGANHNSTNAWSVTIPASTIAGLTPETDYDVYVKVTDQTGKQLKVWWSFQKEANDRDHFFFVDNSKVSNGTGTFTAPFNTINEAGWLAAGDGSQAAQKILVIRQGNSQDTPYKKFAGWNWTKNQFPSAIINIPQEQPVVDGRGNTQMWGWGDATANDFYITGIKAINGDENYNSGGFPGAFASEYGHCWQRAMIWNNIFDTVRSWPLKNQNTSFIMTNNCALTRKHFALIGNTFRNSADSATLNEGAAIMLDGLSYFLVDNNVAENFGSVGSGTGTLMFSKRNITDGTIRRWTATNNVNVTARGVDLRIGSGSKNGQYRNLEICYNNIALSSGGYTVEALRIGVEQYDYADGPHHIYRNTLKAALAPTRHQQSCTELLDVRSNVSNKSFATTVLNPLGNCTKAIPLLSKNIESVPSESFQTDNTLTDEFLTVNDVVRGIVGHEIR